MNKKRSSPQISWYAYALILSAVVLVGLLFVKHASLAQAISRDPLTLLPHGHQGISTADRNILDAAQSKQKHASDKQIIVLINAENTEQTHQARQAFEQVLQQHSDILIPNPIQSGGIIQSALDYYTPHAFHMISVRQKQKLLALNDQDWAAQVQKNASMPFSLGVSFAQDPLGNLQDWLTHQSEKTAIYQNESGAWETQYEGQIYAVLFYQTVEDGLSLNTNAQLLQTIDQARQAILQFQPNAHIYAAGIPLHVAVATEQANYEMSLFGSISTVAVLLLVWMAYHSIRATLAIAASLVYGTLLAFFVTLWVFGEVHILTLVFGTSLIGVAEDFGFHFLAARQNAPNDTVNTVKKHIRAGMFFAFSTTILSYLFLGLPPFPALRQMAVFSVAGIIGAAAFVWFLFPYLFKTMGAPTRLNHLFARSWRYFIQYSLPVSKTLQRLIYVVLAVLVVAGLGQLSFKDDLRQLQNSPNWLMQEQGFVGQALHESNSQFFLVTGNSAQQVLEREELLRAALDKTLAPLSGVQYRATSEWLPSIQAQQQSERLALQRFDGIKNLLGLNLNPTTSAYITPDNWLSQPFTQNLQTQWLGQQADGRWATVVNILGKVSSEQLNLIAQSAQAIDGVVWVDNLAQYSQLLAQYRNIILGILVLSYIATWLLLRHRYGKNALLILLPPAFSSVLTLAILGWLGISVQLFTVLPLLLVLGMGEDYGIFLIEHVKEQEKMWMVTCLSTISTILSLGMLGLSQTPALHILGLSLGLGIGFSWILAAAVGKYFAQKQTPVVESGGHSS